MYLPADAFTIGVSGGLSGASVFEVLFMKEGTTIQDLQLCVEQGVEFDARECGCARGVDLVTSGEFSLDRTLGIWMVETLGCGFHDGNAFTIHVANKREKFGIGRGDEEAVHHVVVEFVREVECSGGLPGLVEGEDVVEVGVDATVVVRVAEGGTDLSNVSREEVVVDGWTWFRGFDGRDVGLVGCESSGWQRVTVEEKLNCGIMVVGVEQTVGGEVGDTRGVGEVGLRVRHAPDGETRRMRWNRDGVC